MVNGPNNGNNQPQCAISVNANNTATMWSFCIGNLSSIILMINLMSLMFSTK